MFRDCDGLNQFRVTSLSFFDVSRRTSLSPPLTICIPYNPYLAHRALSKLEFPIGNIYCIIPKKRTSQPLQLSIIIILISY